jgi:Diphosphoinositol pentakisphosphate kinase 2 N-terminal domain
MENQREHPPKRAPSFSELDSNNEGQEKDSESIKVGICAMAKKANCGPMTEILNRLNVLHDFEIIIFPETTIIEDAIEVHKHFI